MPVLLSGEDQFETWLSGSSAGAFALAKSFRPSADARRAVRNDEAGFAGRLASAGTGRGDVYMDKNDYDNALADYSKAIELNPREADTYNSRAWTYVKAGKPGQGLPDAERSLELHPNNANALDTRGHILRHWVAAKKPLPTIDGHLPTLR